MSLLLCVVIAPAVAYGLLAPDAYRGLGAGLATGSRAQDLLSAATLPVLVIAASRSRGGSLPWHVLWLGILFYLAYSYAIYLIGWPQNQVFLLYVLIVLLATSALLDGLVRVAPDAVREAFADLTHTRGLGWFLITVGVAFVGLWLTDLGPAAIGAGDPLHLGVGGTAFPVYVLDLTVALPAVIATGVLLVRGHPMAVFLAGVVLVKVTTLFVALWLGVLAQLATGEDVPLTADMVPSALLPLVTVAVLVTATRRLRPPRAGWLGTELWPTST